MKEFKNHLQEQINIKKQELIKLNEEIANYPNPEEIDLKKYGPKENLKRSYYNATKTSLLKRIIGPTKLDLQTYIRNKELKKLNNRKKSYESKIIQMIDYLNASNETGLIQEIITKREVIRQMLSYAKTHYIDPKALLNHMINLFQHSKDLNNIEDKIKSNIASFFDYEGKLLPNSEIKTIKMMFEKFFMMILDKKEMEEYQILIEQIVVEIKIEQPKKNEKSALEQKKESLKKIQEFVRNAEEHEYLDLKQFKILLCNAGIPEKQQKTMISNLDNKIKEKRARSERNKINEIINKYLTEDEKALLRRATELESVTEGKLKDLLTRSKKDVISICRYFTIMDVDTELNDTIEILTDRLRVLRNIVSNIENKKLDESKLFYIINKDGLPLVIRNIESFEITNHPVIYNLIYRVSNNEKAKKIFTIEGIDFYRIIEKDIKAIFAEVNGKRILIEIIHNKPNNIIKKHIKANILTQIIEITNNLDDSNTQTLHATYENVVLESLNPRSPSHSLTLTYEEE